MMIENLFFAIKKSALLLSTLLFVSCISESEKRINTSSDKIFTRPWTGSQPYGDCLGYNEECIGDGCSQIIVKGPTDSDVLVTIKSKDFNNLLVGHAYIRSNTTFTFELENGTYQTFFYYGNDWDRERIMKKKMLCDLKGGFNSSEFFGKDTPQYLNNNILTYELILQKNGNFSTKKSSPDEAF
jgi:hypothetical protein